MEDAISKDNVEVTIIRSDTKRMERCTPDQLDAVISTLSWKKWLLS